MERFESHLRSAAKIIESYNGKLPFAIYLKQYYAANKKHGSKDRRAISELCFNYWRIKNVLTSADTLENIRMAHELMQQSDALLTQHIFPLQSFLSDKIDKASFIAALLKQPRLFCRVRPGKQKIFQKKCAKDGLDPQQIFDDCYAFAPTLPLQNHFAIDKEIVIQDVASQQVFNNLEAVGKVSNVWDSCAASGGKSILFYDRYGSKAVNIFATDIRESILKNYEARMKAAAVPFVKTDMADLEKGIPANYQQKFELVICDVPCSGSGTWARSPEQISLFREEEIKTYADKQLSIATNALKGLKPNCYMYYITCSVFAAENEAIIEKLKVDPSIKEISSGYHQFPGIGGDCLYSCLLRKN